MKFIFLILPILFISLPVQAKDRFLENDPRIGQTVTAASPLFIVSDFEEWGIPKLPGTPDYSATTLEQMQSCAGCPNDKIKLERIYPRNSEFKIIKVLLDDKKWYEVDSSSIEYLVLQAKDGLKIIAPEFTFTSHDDSDIESQEKLLSGFTSPDQKKSFYVQEYFFADKLKTSAAYPECPDYETKLKPIIIRLREYTPDKIKEDPQSCSFTLWANQKTLGYMLMRKKDWYVEISPLN